MPPNNHRSGPVCNLIQTFLTRNACDIIFVNVAATAAAADIHATTGRRTVGHSTRGARGGCDTVAVIYFRLDADEMCYSKRILSPKPTMTE